MATSTSNFRGPVFAALALAFASFGDAFLYPYLPLQSGHIGIPVAWVGILLSINRFIRIFTNTLIVNLFSIHGLRLITIVAVIMAIISTAGYGFVFSIVTWIVLRIMWGLSYSALRTSAIAHAIDHPQQGLALGISKSLQEAGPMIALLLAPLLLEFSSPRDIFLVLAIASLPALYFAFSLPADQTIPEQKVAPLRSLLKIPSTFNLITFSSSFLIDGLMVIALGTLILAYGQNVTPFTATALAAAYLGYRRICLLLLSSAGGWIADRIGLDKVFTWSLFLTLSGLIVFSLGWIETGALITFTFYSIQSALAPGSATKQDANKLFAIAENATWRDIGAATGTLVGGFLLMSKQLPSILLIATFTLVILLFFYLDPVRKTVKVLLSWK